MLIQVCLNGSREPGTHAALPLTPEELAHEARRAVDASAQEIHLHPRLPDGRQTFDADVCRKIFSAVRSRCPGTPIGGTTIDIVEPDVARRLALIAAWNILPDYVSVNFSEQGTAELCQLLLGRGIGIEAGLSTVEEVQVLLDLGLANRSLRLLIEPGEEDEASATATAEEIIKLLDASGVHTPLLLHGQETAAWPLLAHAIRGGYATRIGLEDTLLLPDGNPAKDNAELVSLARQWALQAGRG